jgi:endonuclease/exonuclease/phosphatase (EEP) superfamily protein YafD
MLQHSKTCPIFHCSGPFLHRQYGFSIPLFLIPSKKNSREPVFYLKKLLLIMMYKKTKILCTTLILASVAACGYNPVRTPFTLSDGRYDTETVFSNSVRILNWNIHKEGNTREWEQAIVRIVKDKNPDLLLLQEVRLDGNVGSFISENLQYGWEFSPNVYQKHYKAYSGVLTASHIKPQTVKAALSRETEFFSAIKKTVLLTKYPVSSPSSELLIINIHAINFTFGLDGFKEQMRCVAEAVAGHDGPVILAGDFNTWRDERYDILNNLARDMQLKKVDFGPDEDHIADVFGNTLDHIFISTNSLEVVSGSQDVIADIKPSDHRPLFVELRIKVIKPV